MRHHRARLHLLFCAGLLLAVAVSGCAAPGENSERELTVFAASSLTDAFDELADTYEADNPGLTIIRNYASSSQLATQLVEGAEADVYASANERQMGVAQDGERISGDPSLFATNRLVVIAPADNPANIGTPADLAQPGIKLVLASPGVPIRDYADQVIAMLGDDAFRDAVYANLVSEETNVRQVVTKVALGEADAGIVYTSDVTPEMADQITQVAIPDEVNVIARYPIAQVENAPNAQDAQGFISFVLSENGQAILQRWGFGPAPVQ